VLGPRVYLPLTRIYIRRAESWIFYNPNPNYCTPPSSTVDLSNDGGPIQPFDHHRGQKFIFSGLHFRRTFGSPPKGHELAHYVPARDEERDIIQEKLETEVQVIVLIKYRYYRQVRLPSLAINRDTLTLSFDWKEMLCATLPVPDNIRRLQEMRPSVVWIPQLEDEDFEEQGFIRRVWRDNMNDSGSDMEQDSDREDPLRDSTSSESSEDGFDLGAITPTPGSLLFAQMYGDAGAFEEKNSDQHPSSDESAPPITSPSSSIRGQESYQSGDWAECLGLARVAGDKERGSEGACTKPPIIHPSSSVQPSEDTVLHTFEAAGASKTLLARDMDSREGRIPSEEGIRVHSSSSTSSHRLPNVYLEEDSAAFGTSPSAATVPSAKVCHDSAEGISSRPVVHEYDLLSSKERPPPILQACGSLDEAPSRKTLEYQERGIQLGDRLTYQEKGVQVTPIQLITSSVTGILRVIGRRFSWP